MSKTVYTKTFTRDFTLPWVQIWYEVEAQFPKPWNHKTNPSFPYIVFVRKDDTVTSYYDPAGLTWSKNSVFSQARSHKRFLNESILNVNRVLQPIYEFLKKGVLGQKEELLEFLEAFKNSYSWLLVMWEIGETDPDQLPDLNFSSIIKLKESTVRLTDEVDNLIRDSLKKIYTSSSYSHVLTLEEIKSGIIPYEPILKARDAGFIYTDSQLFPPSKLKFVENKYNLQIEKPNLANISVIKGTPASVGYAKGKVRRVMSTKHLDSFAAGEILVSPMTMPDFVPAMKKAAAIITDEGGITCHAAILAREFNVPCIVGTKIASEALKNGDLVEVDAQKGTITIIS